MEIRRAGVSDIPGIIRFMENYHPSSNLSDVPIDKPSLSKIVEWYVTHRDCYPVIVADDQEVHGILFGSLEPYFFNRKRSYGTDMIFAANRDGDKLWKKFKQWAFANGADRIIMGVSSGVERSDRLLEVLGMTKTGGMYVIRR